VPGSVKAGRMIIYTDDTCRDMIAFRQKGDRGEYSLPFCYTSAFALAAPGLVARESMALVILCSIVSGHYIKYLSILKRLYVE